MLSRKSPSRLSGCWNKLLLDGSCYLPGAGLQACHTLAGVAGMSMLTPRRSGIAFAIAFMIAAIEPVVPASPTPFTPSGFVVARAFWLASAIGGLLVAGGIGESLNVPLPR